MVEQRREQRREISELSLWFGLFGASGAWLAHLAVSYPLVGPLCASGWGAILHAVALVTGLVALASLAVSWQAWQRLRAAGPDGSGQHDRRRFMALAGVIKGGIFLLAIVAQWLPVLFVSPCNFAP
ncbi:MAG TPA: hypothetical protein PKD53_13765 [Chloroflexaceae bacterium]|nr:hypothetical protein [Chloroflexaceae bacterium]